MGMCQQSAGLKYRSHITKYNNLISVRYLNTFILEKKKKNNDQPKQAILMNHDCDTSVSLQLHEHISRRLDSLLQ